MQAKMRAPHADVENGARAADTQAAELGQRHVDAVGARLHRHLLAGPAALQ